VFRFLSEARTASPCPHPSCRQGTFAKISSSPGNAARRRHTPPDGWNHDQKKTRGRGLAPDRKGAGTAQNNNSGPVRRSRLAWEPLRRDGGWPGADPPPVRPGEIVERPPAANPDLRWSAPASVARVESLAASAIVCRCRELPQAFRGGSRAGAGCSIRGTGKAWFQSGWRVREGNSTSKNQLWIGWWSGARPIFTSPPLLAAAGWAALSATGSEWRAISVWCRKHIGLGLEPDPGPD